MSGVGGRPAPFGAGDLFHALAPEVGAVPAPVVGFGRVCEEERAQLAARWARWVNSCRMALAPTL